ncbi:MAG: hypothetical protein ACR2M1_07900 [Gemmatimonadaceae bacterium]
MKLSEWISNGADGIARQGIGQGKGVTSPSLKYKPERNKTASKAVISGLFGNGGGAAA